METSRNWRRGLFGYSEADLLKALAEAEASHAMRLASLTSELSALKSEIGVVADLVGQRKRRIAELQAVKARLEAAQQEAGAIWPHLSHLAKRHLQEVEAEMGAQRAVAEEQVAAVEDRLAQERADFRGLLLRLEALAEGLLVDGAPGGGTVAAPAPDLVAAAAGLSPADQFGDEDWRPGMIGPSGQAVEPAAPVPADAAGPAPVSETVPESETAATTPTEVTASTSAPADVRSRPDAADVAMGIRADLWKMLAGKTVGVDLVLPNGTVLARAGTPITEQLVDRARSANLLADLILDMTFAPEEN